MFRYPKTFQCDYGSEFKSDVTNLLEKHNVEICRTTTKYKYMHTAIVEACMKDLAKALFQVIVSQNLQTPEKMSTISMQNLESFVRKTNNTKSLMIDIKPKDTIKEKI